MTIDKFEGEYAFLSNFFESPIKFAKQIWPTAEHLYQALKTPNHEERELIRKAPTPGKAKKLGQKVKMRDNWDRAKKIWMAYVIKLKFQQNPDLAHQLVSTGEKKLVEGNTWGDTEWGVCEGKGENTLGILLQELRSQLKHKVSDLPQQ